MPMATDNNFPYVYCNPNQKTNVTQKDRVFVLGRLIPKDLIIDYERKGWEEGQGTSNQRIGEKDGNIDGKMNPMENGGTVGGPHVTKDFYGLRNIPNTINVEHT